MPQSFRASLVAICLVALAGCRGDVSPTSPSAVFDIQDGAHGASGNPHFFFLRPLVKPPATYVGTFDPTQSPTVEICEWNGINCVRAPVASFSMTGAGSDAVRVDIRDEAYIVNWHTDRSDLDATKIYRIRVLIDAYELGHADIDPVVNGSQLRNVNTGEYIGLVNGRTLPIRFRVEQGAVAPASISSIGLGASHSCALDTGGRAYCWGNNRHGELGAGTVPVGWSLPRPVQGDHVFQAIDAGGFSTCALTSMGAAYCWGDLGEPLVWERDIAPATPPLVIPGGHAFTMITVGGWHACGLDSTGVAHCWGYNGYGQLGSITTDAYVTTPVAVPGLAFRSVSAGGLHTCGIAADGQAYCWGSNYYGTLGNGTAPQLGTSGLWIATPQPVIGGSGLAAVSAGEYATCALSPTGGASCWGYNAVGSLGRGTLTEIEPAAAPVLSDVRFARLSMGGLHTCGLTPDGTGHCWGYNNSGQIGVGTAGTGADQPIPVPVIGPSFVVLEAGRNHTCGLQADGRALCWGDNGWGQLGNLEAGSPNNRSLPVPVDGGLTFMVP